MSLTYRALWYICLPLWTFWYLLFTWRRPEFRQGFWQRYGWVPRHAQRPLVIHAASVGEVNAVAGMVKQLLAKADIPILITSTTPTGRDRVKLLFAKQHLVKHCYLPFDMGIAQRLFLCRIKPRGVILVETELWPSLLRLCKRQKVPVWLVNGRMSQRSAKLYKRFSSVVKPMLQGLNKILLQDKGVAKRFVYLGAESDRIKVMGNVKFDLQIPPAQKPELASQWLAKDESCWVCGSTREGEEAILLQAWAKMKTINKGLLVLVPRHPKRFEEVADLCAQSGLPWRTFSQGDDTEFNQQQGRRVLLVDSMGWLLDFYRLADLAFVGGSLVQKGGQNPLEPAALGKAVIIGPHTYNFAHVCELLYKAGNVLILAPADLVEQVPALLANSAITSAMGEAGVRLVQQQSGATDAYVTLLLATFADTTEVKNAP